MSVLDSSKHWQQRAEEARSIAEQLSDLQSRRMTLGIAADYARLAEHAEQRAKKQKTAS